MILSIVFISSSFVEIGIQVVVSNIAFELQFELQTPEILKGSPFGHAQLIKVILNIKYIYYL